MNVIIPHLISQDIIIKCVSSLSTSILSTYNLYNFITTHSNSDYQNYVAEITSTDIANKLLVASSLIKDIIKRHHEFELSTQNTELNGQNMLVKKDENDKKNISVEKIIEMYKLKLEPDVIDDVNSEYNIVTQIQNNNIISNVPEPVKIALNSTLEIIDKINGILNTIHLKIKTHSGSYVKYVSKLNLSHEVNMLIKFDKIFDKRLKLFIDVLKIYPNICT